MTSSANPPVFNFSLWHVKQYCPIRAVGAVAGETGELAFLVGTGAGADAGPGAWASDNTLSKNITPRTKISFFTCPSSLSTGHSSHDLLQQFHGTRLGFRGIGCEEYAFCPVER